MSYPRAKQFVAAFSMALLSLVVSAQPSAAPPNESKAIHHRARPAKREARPANIYANLNDDDVIEQIEVYGADDEISYVNTLCDTNCLLASTAYFVSRKQIEEMGARTLLDILKTLPGFDVSREVSGYYRVSSRGLRDDPRMKLLIDGRSLQDIYNGRNYWQIPADLIERVDVFVGPQSARFGVGALNGVVNVVTRRQEGVVGHVYAGGFSSYVGSLALGKKTSATENYLSAQFEVEDGPKIPIESDRFSHLAISRDASDLTTHASRLAASVVGSTDIVIARSIDAHFVANAQLFFEERGPYIGAFDASGPNSKLSWLTWKGDIGLRFSYATDNTFDLKFYADQNYVRNLFQLTPSNYVVDDNVRMPQVFSQGIMFNREYNVLNIGTEIKNTLQLFSGNTLSFGGNIEASGLLRNSFLFSMNRTMDGLPQEMGTVEGLAIVQNNPCNLYGFQSSLYSACRMTLSAMVQDEWHIERVVKLLAGIRLSSMSDVDFEWWSHLNPRAGVVFLPGRNWSAKVLYQTGVRPPTFEEQYDQTSRAFVNISSGQFVGNELLRPEWAHSLETGVAYRDFYDGVRYLVEGNLYLANVANAIERIDVKGDLNTLNDLGGYYSIGAEGNAQVNFRDGSNIFFNVAWFRSYWRDVDAKGLPSCQIFAFSGTQNNICSLITNLPQIRVNIGANLVVGRLGSLNFTTELGSERRNNVRADLERQRQYRIAPYALLNISFRSKPIFEHFYLHGSVFNLLNFRVKDDVARPDNLPNLMPREGVAWYVGLSVVI